MIPALRRILCIDDEEDILQVAKMSLEMVGSFEVSLCRGSAEAVATAARLRPDLILLDVMMPQMDGPTTLVKLREQEDCREIPVVFMTAKVQPAEVQRYLELGALGVVSKPFDPIKLPEQIQSLWKKHNEPNP